jgi:hypothetical protein
MTNEELEALLSMGGQIGSKEDAINKQRQMAAMMKGMSLDRPMGIAGGLNNALSGLGQGMAIRRGGKATDERRALMDQQNQQILKALMARQQQPMPPQNPMQPQPQPNPMEAFRYGSSD